MTYSPIDRPHVEFYKIGLTAHRFVRWGRDSFGSEVVIARCGQQITLFRSSLNEIGNEPQFYPQCLRCEAAFVKAAKP